MNSLFYWSTIYLSSTVCHDTDIKAMFTDIKVNDDRKSAIFESDRDIFQGISFYESRHFVLYQWSSYLHSFPDITHKKVNNGIKIKLTFCFTVMV